MMKQIGLVFDQDHRVPAFDQSTHRLGNALGVARMQADGRFVEHVKHIDQVRAEQIRQVDPLGFATTEGVHGARQGHVPKTDLLKVPQSREDLGQSALDSQVFVGGEVAQAVLDRLHSLGELIDRLFGPVLKGGLLESIR